MTTQSLLPGQAPVCVLLVSSLRNFAAISGAVSGWALGWVGNPGFAEAAPLVAGAGGQGVGPAVHHPGIQAIGH